MKNNRKLFFYDEDQRWERSAKGQFIPDSDTAVELGHPQTESLSFHLWTTSPGKIHDNQISIIGSEPGEAMVKRLPFGKIILIGGHGFTEDNAHERYQEMELLRIKLNLTGYMLRAIPQQNKEWSRISLQAIKSNFSLRVLGNELIREYKTLDYVDAVEVIFITSSPEDIRSFKPVGEKVYKINRAMNKIIDNLEYDCASCEFNDVCNAIDDLKSMHRKANKIE